MHNVYYIINKWLLLSWQYFSCTILVWPLFQSAEFVNVWHQLSVSELVCSFSASCLGVSEKPFREISLHHKSQFDLNISISEILEFVSWSKSINCAAYQLELVGCKKVQMLESWGKCCTKSEKGSRCKTLPFYLLHTCCPSQWVLPALCILVGISMLGWTS